MPEVCRHGHPWTSENTYYAPNGTRRCRTCKRQHDRQGYQANLEKERERSRRRSRARSAAGDYEAQRRWKARNQEHLRRYNEQWRKDNPEYFETYYEKNPDQRRINMARWREANPEKNRELRRRYRSLKREAYVAPVEEAAIWERDEGVCGICQRPVEPDDWHLDHIIPLARGGTHEPTNVQVAHPSCNVRKNAKLPEELTSCPSSR